MSERTLREAVSAWIREDAGTAVKLSITPAQVNALVSRILDAHTAAQPAPDAVAERPLPQIRFGVHSRPINPNDDR